MFSFKECCFSFRQKYLISLQASWFLLNYNNWSRIDLGLGSLPILVDHHSYSNTPTLAKYYIDLSNLIGLKMLNFKIHIAVRETSVKTILDQQGNEDKYKL